jgi:hypothetical protein
MQELRANTEVKVKIGPAVAVANGYVPVTTLDLSTADEAELFKHDAAAVTDISAATFAAITSADGYYNLTLTTSHTDTEGLLDVIINDDSLILPIKASFMVLAEAAWDSKYVAKDDGFMDVNIKTVGRADTQETEATNLEAACAAYSATRGLSGTALPAAAADAAGGLVISDAGGFDIDNRAPAAASVTNMNVVFNTDFATNYDTTLDMWNVDVTYIAGIAAPTPVTGTADSGTTLTMVDAARTEADADYWKDSWILFTSGTISGQCRLITAFDAGTDTITFSPATTQAVSTNTYEIIPAGRVDAGLIAGQTITAAAGVTFPTSVASPTNITAGTITTVTNLTNAPTAGDLTSTMKASVNTEVLDVLNTDTFAEPGQGTPSATTTLVQKIGFLFKAWRNRTTQTASEYALYSDDAVTKDQEAVVSDDGTTTTRGEVSTGA